MWLTLFSKMMLNELHLLLRMPACNNSKSAEQIFPIFRFSLHLKLESFAEICWQIQFWLKSNNDKSSTWRPQVSAHNWLGRNFPGNHGCFGYLWNPHVAMHPRVDISDDVITQISHPRKGSWPPSVLKMDAVCSAEMFVCSHGIKAQTINVDIFTAVTT
jgi:hypothetical protein